MMMMMYNVHSITFRRLPIVIRPSSSILLSHANVRAFSSFSSSSQKDEHPNTDLFLQHVQSALPNVDISTNKYSLESHGKGESYHPCAPPKAVLTPNTNEEISNVLQLCNQHHVSVIPYGTGTSVEGHVAALDAGSISLDMKKFKFVEDIIEDATFMNDPCITVGAGVTRLELNDLLRHTGMQFMVDPGADASIGGMVACGASGTTAVKYGTMRENILGLQCVLPNGTIAKCGTKALKSSAGYDLVSLMTGSEGTLGVITHVTVRLHAIPDNVIAATCTFETIHDAAEAVSIMRLSGVSIDRCEILDESSIMAFLKYNGEAHNAMSIQPTLFLEFSGPSNIAVEENVNVTKSICNEYNGLDFKFTANDEERKELWKARHTLYYASIALRSGATGAIVTDACVPLSQFANIISKTVEDVKRLEVIGPCFGHAGDGNFHCILPICDDDQHEYIDKLHEINHNLIQRTIEVGGTCTGEHGVGYGKIKYLKNQYGEGGVEMMKMVKVGLDPNNIMNPGKVVLV